MFKYLDIFPLLTSKSTARSTLVEDMAGRRKKAVYKRASKATRGNKAKGVSLRWNIKSCSWDQRKIHLGSVILNWSHGRRAYQYHVWWFSSRSFQTSFQLLCLKCQWLVCLVWDVHLSTALVSLVCRIWLVWSICARPRTLPSQGMMESLNNDDPWRKLSSIAKMSQTERRTRLKSMQKHRQRWNLPNHHSFSLLLRFSL